MLAGYGGQPHWSVGDGVELRSASELRNVFSRNAGLSPRTITEQLSNSVLADCGVVSLQFE